MEKSEKQLLRREDWLREALEVLQERGVDGVKVVVIAKRLGVTSGSFYWHFKDLPDLHDSLLKYWEFDLTDGIINQATTFDGSPAERILNLMLQVIEHDAATLDHTISIWARNNPGVNEIYQRTLQKRFDFATWMFREVGFSARQAGFRGRLMVAYLMGESSTNLKSVRNWKSIIRDEFELMTGGNNSKAPEKA